MAKLDQLYARLQGMPGTIELLWRVADHFDHPCGDGRRLNSDAWRDWNVPRMLSGPRPCAI